MTFPPGWNQLSTVGTVSAGELFVAHDNAVAVSRVRFYIDQLDLSVQRCAQCPAGECSLCIERGRIVADIRALLPEVTE